MLDQSHAAKSAQRIRDFLCGPAQQQPPLHQHTCPARNDSLHASASERFQAHQKTQPRETMPPLWSWASGLGADLPSPPKEPNQPQHQQKPQQTMPQHKKIVPPSSQNASQSTQTQPSPQEQQLASEQARLCVPSNPHTHNFRSQKIKLKAADINEHNARELLTMLLDTNKGVGLKLQWVANMTGFSRSAISFWRQGKYAGNNSVVARVVSEALVLLSSNDFMYSPELHDGMCRRPPKLKDTKPKAKSPKKEL